MTEWLSNRLSVALGPPAFGRPYSYGKINYDHEPTRDQQLSGHVEGVPLPDVLPYTAALENSALFEPCDCELVPIFKPLTAENKR